MKYENGTAGRNRPFPRSLKVTCEDADSFTRLLDSNRYAALVFAQSWHANGIGSPMLRANCRTSFLNRRPTLTSSNRHAASSWLRVPPVS